MNQCWAFKIKKNRICVDPSARFVALYDSTDSDIEISEIGSGRVVRTLRMGNVIGNVTWSLRADLILATDTGGVSLVEIETGCVIKRIEKPGIFNSYLLTNNKILVVYQNRLCFLEGCGAKDTEYFYDYYFVYKNVLILFICDSLITVMNCDQKIHRIISAPPVIYDNFRVNITKNQILFMNGYNIWGKHTKICLNDLCSRPPDGFYTSKGYLSLYFKTDKNLVIYDLETKKESLVLGADVYCASDNYLFVISDGILSCYFERPNIPKDFCFIDKNIEYKEKENEFDVSDDSLLSELLKGQQ
jgi:hypothetical protein